jgi:ABC-type amino acid transport system permease subunit
VAVPDLMYTSSIITAETYRPLDEIYTSAAAIYLLMLYPLTLCGAALQPNICRCWLLARASYLLIAVTKLS